MRPLIIGLLLLVACSSPSPSASEPVAPSATSSSPATGDATLIEPSEESVEESGQELAAGTYYVDTPFPVRLAFEVPEATTAWAYTSAGTQLNLAWETRELSFEIVENVVADPCSTEQLDPPVGPSVDDLVDAISSLDGFEATAATDVSIDGYNGKQFVLTAPAHDEAACRDLYTWSTTTRQNGVGPGEVAEIQIVDVAGVRLLVALAYPPPISSASRSTTDAILDSVQLEP
jgi:hypothetical protein